jgi:hypothetical protein
MALCGRPDWNDDATGMSTIRSAMRTASLPLKIVACRPV